MGAITPVKLKFRLEQWTQYPGSAVKWDMSRPGVNKLRLRKHPLLLPDTHPTASLQPGDGDHTTGPDGPVTFAKLRIS